jgi:outer membrane lipopolysaccharide assembly protein LptE/RlpB
MSLRTSSDSVLSSVIEIFESFPAEEQMVWLKAMEREQLMREARKLSKSLKKKAPKISMLEIVNEVNKVRKENGYQAYSV